MAVIDLQRRMRQLGEIRIGHVVPTSNGKTRPEKLDRFRFTSPSQAILGDVAKAYGGQVKEWDPANGGPREWEVYTDSHRLPVIIPPLAVTQWYEQYAGSKCVRRCDGRIEQKSDKPCLCDPERRKCSLTTRLNVMLRDVPPIGHWLLTSRGYYAAVELPPVAELLAKGGGHVPGWLSVEERRIVREKPDGGTETVRFMVPTLDIDLAPAQILSGGVEAAALGGGDRKALEPGAGPRDWQAEIGGASSRDDLLRIRQEAAKAGVPNGEEFDSWLVTRMAEIKQQSDPPPAGNLGAQADPEADRIGVWQQILAAAPPGWGPADLERDFAERNGGLVPATAEPAELQGYLEQLREGAIAAETVEGELVDEKVPF
jgi:hypothetical protein